MKIRNIAHIILGAYVFVTLGAGLPMLINGPSDFRNFVEDKNPLLNYIQIILPISLSIIYALYSRQRVLLPSNNIPFLLLIVLSMLSLFWSGFPSRTIIFSIWMAIQLASAILICATTPYEHFFRIVRFVCIVIMLLSFSFIFLMPGYGTMTYQFPGAWQGIFTHKNILGQFCVVSICVFLTSYLEHRRLSDALFFFAIIFLLIGSGSSTALVVTAFCCLPVILAFTPRMLRFDLLFIVLGFVAVFLGNFNAVWAGVTEALGKSETLTGRTEVWELAIARIQERPWFGFGLGGFWPSTEASILRVQANWFVPHAHNGFLEVLLQLGFVGLAFFIWGLVRFAKSALTAVSSLTPYRLFPVLALCAYLGLGTTEIVYFNVNSFFQFVVFVCIEYFFRLSDRSEPISPDGSARARPLYSGSYPQDLK